jgi:uncharacterized membrane protein YbhN (UPF0104 family)
MQPIQVTPPRWVRRLNIGFLLCGVLALAWLIYALGLDRLADGLTRLGWGFALSTGAFTCGILLDGVTMRACAGPRGHELPYWHFARASFAGHAINQATPLGSLGEVTKVTILSEKVPPARATATLIVLNIVMFVVNCGLIALGPVVAVLVLDPGPTVTLVLVLGAMVFFIAGAVALVFLRRGPGDVPFRVALRLGVGPERVGRWRARWHAVESDWLEASGDRRQMAVAWVSGVLSRTAAAVEAMIILHFLGAEQIVAVGLLSLAGYQLVNWLTAFVPMQAGTSEGGAYVLFAAVGLSPVLGVLLELVRRIRRLVFICAGVAVLGWPTFRRLMKRDPA